MAFEFAEKIRAVKMMQPARDVLRTRRWSLWGCFFLFIFVIDMAFGVVLCGYVDRLGVFLIVVPLLTVSQLVVCAYYVSKVI